MSRPARLFYALAAALALRAATAAAATIVTDSQPYIIENEDVFVDIARKFDLGYNALRAANPGVDPWIPRVGSFITLPLGRLLPDAPHRGIVINLAEQRLYYFMPDGEIKSFPVGVVRQGMTMPDTPGRVIAKRKNPTWIPPASVRKDHPDLPRAVPPGPDNPLGHFALYTSWPQIRIHGTNQPMGIGRRVSHGCISLYPEDIEWLFSHIQIGTPLTVVDQPVKAGWLDGRLYLEVHPRLKDADAVEDNGRPPALTGHDHFLQDATTTLLRAAQDRAREIDWAEVDRQVEARDGLPRMVLKELVSKDEK